MPLLLSLLGNKWVWIGLALAGALGWGQFQTFRLHGAQDRLTAVTAAFDTFKAQVRAEGEVAQKAAKQAELAAIQRAKESDDANKAKLRDLDAAYAAYRLRVKSGSGATGRIVPAAASGPGSNPGICYDRDSLDREITAAVGRLRSGLADDAEPFDKAAVVARTCKEWAR